MGKALEVLDLVEESRFWPYDARVSVKRASDYIEKVNKLIKDNADSRNPSVKEALGLIKEVLPLLNRLYDLIFELA